MRITQARSFMLVVPVGRDIADSMQNVSTLEIVGVIIDTDENVSGTGYTYAGTSAGAFNQGHNLHVLTNTSTANYIIPVFPPGC